MGKYFTIKELTHSETAISKNIDNSPSEEVIKNLNLLIDNVLDKIRAKYGSSISVNSGYRCEKLNDTLKGSKTSHHKFGLAADIRCKDNKKLWDLIVQMIEDKEIQVTQLIDEKNLKWIHISYVPSNLKNQIFAIK